MNISGNYYNYTNSLFSATNSSSSSGSGSILGEYASIKNGTYKKLLKAYYAKQKEESSTTGSTSSSDATTKSQYQSAREDADVLSNAVDKLTAKGKNSLFNKVDKTVTDEKTGVTTTTKDYDYDKIASAVKDYVSAYNSVLDSSSKTDNTYILRKASLMTIATKANSEMLSKIGITIGKDNQLKFDETTFKDADINDIKTMFQGTNSYANKIGAKADEISRKAVSEVNSTKLYGMNGKYTVSNMSDLYNALI